jgi:hypothetical protein
MGRSGLRPYTILSSGSCCVAGRKNAGKMPALPVGRAKARPYKNVR